MIDLNGADLNLLVSLDALIEEGNVTKAAARLNVSQPALSAQLARLRDIFRDPLLVPSKTGRGMIPTARALEVRGPLRGALKDLESVVKRPPIFDPLTVERTFAIATSDLLTAVLGEGLIARVQKIAGPGVRVSFRSQNPDLIADQLEHGQIDLAIGDERNAQCGMKSIKLFDDHFFMAQRRGHPRGTKPLDLDTYCMFLRITDHVATLPERFLNRFNDDLDRYELPFKSRGFTVSASWHPRNEVDPAHIWLRNELIAVAAGRDAEA
jgi:DNA-binding transcriptional LysR family regulator